MKTVEINGREFTYETKWISMGEYGDYPVTIFYEGTTTRLKRNGFLGIFGRLVTEEIPKEVFKIYHDSADERLSKSFWRERIEKEIDLLDRKDQLKRGDLI